MSCKIDQNFNTLEKLQHQKLEEYKYFNLKKYLILKDHNMLNKFKNAIMNPFVKNKNLGLDINLKDSKKKLAFEKFL